MLFRSSWDGPLFNLALSFYHRVMYQEAIDTIEKAIKKGGQTGQNLTLKAMCLEKIDTKNDHKPMYQQAIKAFGLPASLSDWELGWYMTAVRRMGDTKAIEQAEKEKTKRKKKDELDVDLEVPLPGVKGGLVVRR